jgi:hypothetical protein
MDELSPLDQARVWQFRAAVDRYLPLEDRAAMLSAAQKTFADNPLRYGLSSGTQSAIGAGAIGAIGLTLSPMLSQIAEAKYLTPTAVATGRLVGLVGEEEAQKLMKESLRAELEKNPKMLPIVLSDPKALDNYLARKVYPVANPGSPLYAAFEAGRQSGLQHALDKAKVEAEIAAAQGNPEALALIQKRIDAAVPHIDEAVENIVRPLEQYEKKRIPKLIEAIPRNKGKLLLGAMGLAGILGGLSAISRANAGSERSTAEQAEAIQQADVAQALSAGVRSPLELALPLVFMSQAR